MTIISSNYSRDCHKSSQNRTKQKDSGKVWRQQNKIRSWRRKLPWFVSSPMTVDFSLFPEECARRWLFFLPVFLVFFAREMLLWLRDDGDHEPIKLTNRARQVSLLFFFVFLARKKETKIRRARLVREEKRDIRVESQQTTLTSELEALVHSCRHFRSARPLSSAAEVIVQRVSETVDKEKHFDTHPRLDSRAATCRLSR